MTAASFSDWAAAGSLGLSAIGLIALAVAFADAEPSDFDPRPLTRRALSAAHQGAVYAGHDINRTIATGERLTRNALRDAAVTVAALLALLFPATGGTR